MRTKVKRVSSIDELTAEARECREFGHWWGNPKKYWNKKRPNGKTINEDRQLQCARCGAERTQEFEISPILGKFVAIRAPRMRYPAGYLMVGRRLSRAEIMYYNYEQEQQHERATAPKPRRRG